MVVNVKNPDMFYLSDKENVITKLVLSDQESLQPLQFQYASLVGIP